MYKKILKYVIIIAVIIIIISIIAIAYSFVSKKNNSESDVYAKIDSEMMYLDTNILKVIHSLNNLNTEYLITNNEANTNAEAQSGETSSESGKPRK